MTTTAVSTPLSTQRYGSAFWERLWRTAGIQSIGLLFIAALLARGLPGIDAPVGRLGDFYEGHHVTILVATALFGFGVLNLLWFAAAIRTTLNDAGRDGWGAAATASSSALGALLFLIAAAFACLVSLASKGDTLGLHHFVWAAFVMTSFPRAMLIMAGSLGLWRAGLVSNGAFVLGVACIVLTLVGGTTWSAGGFWAPDGLYSSTVSPLIDVLWVLGVSGVLLTSRSAKSGW